MSGPRIHGPPVPGPGLVIFDCDGVLIDSETIACRVDAECLTRAGFPTTADEVRDRYVGIGAAGMFADLESRHARPLPPGFADLIHERLARADRTRIRLNSSHQCPPPMPSLA